jgi:hypothetical protein
VLTPPETGKTAGLTEEYWIGFESGMSVAMDWVEKLNRAQIASAKQSKTQTDSRIIRLVFALKRLRAASASLPGKSVRTYRTNMHQILCLGVNQAIVCNVCP